MTESIDRPTKSPFLEPIHRRAGCRLQALRQLGMPKAGGGRGPYMVLGLVSALAVGAIGFVHYDQQKQRQVRGNGGGFNCERKAGGHVQPNPCVSFYVDPRMSSHALGCVHVVQDMRRLINEEKERERQELLASLQGQKEERR